MYSGAPDPALECSSGRKRRRAAGHFLGARAGVTYRDHRRLQLLARESVRDPERGERFRIGAALGDGGAPLSGHRQPVSGFLRILRGTCARRDYGVIAAAVAAALFEPRAVGIAARRRAGVAGRIGRGGYRRLRVAFEALRAHGLTVSGILPDSVSFPLPLRVILSRMQISRLYSGEGQCRTPPGLLAPVLAMLLSCGGPIEPAPVLKGPPSCEDREQNTPAPEGDAKRSDEFSRAPYRVIRLPELRCC